MKSHNLNRLSILISLMLLMFISTGFAQWSFGVGVNQAYNDNPLHIRDAQSSWVSTANLDVYYTSEAFSISYHSSFNQFSEIGDRNFFWHQIALTARRNTTQWGIYAGQQINRDLYNIYDYFSATAYFQHQFNIDQYRAYLNASITTNDYSQVQDLNNWLFASSFRVNRSFATRTTLISGVSYQYKKYQYGEAIEIASDSTVLSSMSPSGWGSGRGTGFPGQPELMILDAPSVSQFSYWLRIAQSLSNTTGLAVQLQQQFSISGDNRYLSGVPTNYSEESQIFDDPLGYQGYSLQIVLTRMFPGQVKLRSGFFYRLKDYTGQGVYEDAEFFNPEILREDHYRNAWLYLQKPILFPGKSGVGVEAYLQYQWTRNTSNSYWYDYKNQTFSIGLDLSF